MSTGDTVLVWITCGILVYGFGMGYVSLYRACQIWRQIRTRRLPQPSQRQEGRR
jgi:hypothetical protein